MRRAAVVAVLVIAVVLVGFLGIASAVSGGEVAENSIVGSIQAYDVRFYSVDGRFCGKGRRMYDPDKPGDAAKAKAACEKATGKGCKAGRLRGSALPGC